MCGFVGVLSPNPNPVAIERLERMLGTIRHRGPDGVDLYTGPHIGLGFCRLAIIDIHGGMQPLWNENKEICLVFNGEIYNHRELRAQLVEKGHIFLTNVDSEVIVHGFEEWGHDLPTRLRGIFAFILWDKSSRRLFLGRDRSGVKPLYFCRVGSEFRFGSEAKALLVEPDMYRDLDLLGYVGENDFDLDKERTPFKNIHLLGAGCYMWVDFTSSKIQRYWKYDPTRDFDGGNIEYTVERFREEMINVVGMQVMSDVPLASYLSGGIDSSSITACMVNHGIKNLVTYTAVFDVGNSPDPEYAKEAAKELGVKSKFININIDEKITSLFMLAAWHSEGEFDLGYISRLLLGHAAKSDGVKVILTGQGIDEMLGGYHLSFDALVRYCHNREVIQATWPSYRGLPPFSQESLQLADLVGFNSSNVTQTDHEALLTASYLQRAHGGLSRGLLRMEDHMGMAAGIEIRVPFLDHKLLELVGKIPQSLRRSLLNDKSILRQSVHNWISPKLASRPKYPFNAASMPLSKLILSSTRGVLKDLLLSAETIKNKGYFDFQLCKKLVYNHQYGLLDHVVVLHLLDEVFISNFESQLNVSHEQSIVINTSDDFPVHNQHINLSHNTIQPQSIPRICCSISAITSKTGIDISGHLQRPEVVNVEFLDPMKGTVYISTLLLPLLNLFDGSSTFLQIHGNLNGAWAIQELLSAAEVLIENGIIELLPNETAQMS